MSHFLECTFVKNLIENNENKIRLVSLRYWNICLEGIHFYCDSHVVDVRNQIRYN